MKSEPHKEDPPLRMRQVHVEDYYTDEEKKRDTELIAAYFSNKKVDINMDGTSVINKFV